MTEFSVIDASGSIHAYQEITPDGLEAWEPVFEAMAQDAEVEVEDNELWEASELDVPALAGEVTLSGRYSVDVDFYQDVVAQVHQIEPHLLVGELYSTKELLGDVEWARMDGVEQRLAVLCLQHFADSERYMLAATPCPNGGYAQFEYLGE